MNAAEFGEFFARQGHRVVNGETCSWRAYKSFLFASIPYHRAVAPSSGEVLQVLLKGPGAVVRFPTDLGKGDRRVGIFLCTDRNYDFPSLHHKSRHCTRRGLENCVIKPVDFDFLARQGHELNVESFRRQGRPEATVTESQWRSYCRTASGMPGFEAWGAWVHGNLAAFMVVARVEDSCYIDYQSCSTVYMHFRPNHALTFSVTRMLLARPEVNSVCYGHDSLVVPGIDFYKERMGFERRPFGEGVVFNPLLRPLLSFGGRQIVAWAARNRPRSTAWRKASLFLSGSGGRSAPEG
jgi:hypothetical protein